LLDADPGKLQDRLIELGNEIIDDMSWMDRDVDDED
jgi:hypothetical protein